MPDERKPAHLFIMTGEASGDLHAAALVRELRDLVPDVRVTAVGGAHLQAVGAELLARIEDFTAFGLVEPLLKIRQLLATLRAILRLVARDRPDLVLLVDFPDFNMILGGRLRARGVPMVYYISPQIWAWRGGRAKKLARLVRKMLCFFPFEEPLYRAVGLDCECVGHPLVDTVRPTRSRRQIREELGLGAEDQLLVWLPGSRPFEINQFVPLFRDAARELTRGRPHLHFALGLASTISEEAVRAHLPGDAPPFHILADRTYDLVHACDFAVVASGTATLECALLERPLLVVGAVNPITYHLGMLFTQLPYFALVNHLAGRQVVPELIQYDATPRAVADIAGAMLDDVELRRALVEEIRAATANLGPPGAASRAAAAVAGVLAELGVCERAPEAEAHA